jgi:hypothetical protein
VKEGSVIKRASCTICYVEENSQEVINNLEGLNDVRGLKAILAPNFTKVVTLTEHTAGVQKVYIENYRDQHRPLFNHAALVVYGSTRKKSIVSGRSIIDLQVEILVEKIPEISPHHSVSTWTWTWTFVIQILIASAITLFLFHP